MTLNEQEYEKIRERMARYNEPPEVPREEIWSAVSDSWGRQRLERDRRRRRRIWIQSGLGIAAVLALGVAIGRFTATPTAVVEQTVAAAPTADAEQNGTLPAAYRRATRDHLEQAETLLLMFASDADEDEVIGIAQSLLVTTRMLLDSRAAEDTSVHEMLQDLELLLAQMAHLQRDSSGSERELVREGIEERSVLPRLRRLLPTGPSDAGV